MVVYPPQTTSDQRGSIPTYRGQRDKTAVLPYRGERRKARWHRSAYISDILLARSKAIETDSNRDTTMSVSGLTNQHSKIQLTQPCINRDQRSRRTAGRRIRVNQGGTLSAITRPGRHTNRDRPSEIAYTHIAKAKYTQPNHMSTNSNAKALQDDTTVSTTSVNPLDP